jgi:hypothetical protein
MEPFQRFQTETPASPWPPFRVRLIRASMPSFSGYFRAGTDGFSALFCLPANALKPAASLLRSGFGLW